MEEVERKFIEFIDIKLIILNVIYEKKCAKINKKQEKFFIRVSH